MMWFAHRWLPSRSAKSGDVLTKPRTFSKGDTPLAELACGRPDARRLVESIPEENSP
jgi:hypothetical protein